MIVNHASISVKSKKGFLYFKFLVLHFYIIINHAYKNETNTKQKITNTNYATVSPTMVEYPPRILLSLDYVMVPYK